MITTDTAHGPWRVTIYAPWRVGRVHGLTGDSPWVHDVVDADGSRVAPLSSGPRNAGDAGHERLRLIAAAPDLLEALKRLKRSAEINMNDYPSDEEIAALDAARAAIAKAEGTK